MGYFRYLYTLFFVSALFHTSFGQLVDSFDDGNFDQNPTWFGDSDLFIVNPDLALQLNDIDAIQNETYLSVNAPTGSTGTWRFHVSLDFSPSGNNFGRVYLNADQANLTSSLNGYFVQIGGISGDQDAIELVKQSGTSETVLISGTPGNAGMSSVDADVEVILDSNSNWNLLVDYNDGQGVINEGSAAEAGNVEGDYFGLVCNYTTQRSEAFTLDDIFIDPIIIDMTPPELVSAEFTSTNTILLTFDEQINLGDITTNNFNVDNGISVTNVNLTSSESQVELVVSPDLSDNTTYVVTASNIADEAGNVSPASTADFLFVEVSPASEFDILINEFMADPTPQVGLPDAEYVELLNNTNLTFQLSDYAIASGGDPVQLPSHFMEPGEYILITDADNLSLFQAFGTALGIEGMPTLTNTMDEILIQDVNRNVVHRINYNMDWYQDNTKEEGGYSVELINPQNACKGQANYRASDNGSGGTPAAVNSVLSDEVDNEPPSFASLFTVDPSTLLLTFSEPVTSFSAEEPINYIISNSLSVNNAALQVEQDQVLLTLSEEIIEGQVFSLQFENISDCIGNTSMLSDSAFFALPSPPEVGDLIINEILFNPFTGGVDYVEVYNNSNRIIDLSDIQIENQSPEVGQFEAVNIDHLLFPETYACITPDKSDILSRYPLENPNTIFENALPRLDDDAGNVSITSFQNGLALNIDSFDYDDDLHSGFIADKNGVSLERINFDTPASEDANWASGAQSTGFGTPGYENAQVIRNPTVTDGEFFEIVNPTFSPDQDGFKDFMQVQFKLDQADFFGSMRIYDDQGREVLQLLPNQILAPSTTVNWDGTTSEGRVAKIGIYILWVELLTPSGDRNVFKEPIVVARNLN